MKNDNNTNGFSSPSPLERAGVRLLVTKETVVYRQCPDCKGGYTTRQFAGEFMKIVCMSCKGSMRKKITHRTEVSLQEALREMGMMINE